MSKYTDLHVHSTYSDGTCTPSEIIDMAVRLELNYIALTDHDTVDGIEEMKNASEIHRKNGYNITIIPGVELSCAFSGPDLHILGLNIDYKSDILIDKLKECKESRRTRNDKMIEKMQGLGFDITKEKIYALYGDVSITRAHFARYLTDMGYTSSKNEAFEKYLGHNGPVYVQRDKLSPKDAIQLIKAAKGHPVLAHPLLYNLDDIQLNELLSQLKEYGLWGIEAIYSLNTPMDEIYLKELAKKYNLFITGGSDFHGTNKPDIKLVTGHGNLKIPEELVTNILKY